MADRYLSWVSGRTGGAVARRLGLPTPVPLRRHAPGRPVTAGPVVTSAADGGRLGERLRAVLDACGADVRACAPGDAPPEGERPAALVLDATGITGPAELDAVHAFLHPRIRTLAACGRILVLGTPPERAADPAGAAAQQALDGLVRSVGKELRRGGTAHLVRVAPGAEELMESTVRFALSARSAYVSGQTIVLDAPPAGAGKAVPEDWERPLAGRTALVTGAARGIGACVAEVLHRDGAHVVCLDVPAQAEALRRTADRVAGTAVGLDITAPDAGERLAERLRDEHGGLDILVHNAGITRDRTLGRMDADRWRSVIAVNLTAAERLTAELLPVLRDGGRVVCTSSISGIAGNAGQTNYAASKAGLIGLVRALAPAAGTAGRGITVNAVAPGFIETRMTAAVPFVVRQAGRRMNSLGQGGQPVDVAEAVAYLASPGTGAVTGQVLRVCGQSLLGA